MKATGIIRRVDDLGRVAIPREIRKRLYIREGDPLELFTGDDGEIILKKYYSLNDAHFLGEYACVLSDNIDMDVIVCSLDRVVAVCGENCEELIHDRISDDLHDAMLEDLCEYRGSITETQIEPLESQYVAAIKTEDKEVIGCVIAVPRDYGENVTDSAISYVEMVAAMIGKMEDWRNEI